MCYESFKSCNITTIHDDRWMRPVNDDLHEIFYTLIGFLHAVTRTHQTCQGCQIRLSPASERNAEKINAYHYPK